MKSGTTKVFFDTEFTGLHQNTTLVSMGMVSECGKTFYAEFNDYDKDQVDDWLKDNVIANLFLTPEDNIADPEHWRLVANSSQIKEAITVWLSQFENVEMWSDCLAYDWVLFCNIFQHAFKIPNNVYHIPLDICPLLHFAMGNAGVNREEYAKVEIEYLRKSLSLQDRIPDTAKHNALWDAFVIYACYKCVDF